MRKLGFIIFLFFFSPFPEQSAGQENYAVKTFTTDQGLPHNHVQSIVQDQNGFIWIATWDGVSRYNGYEFRNYYHNPDDSTTISYFQTENVVIDVYNNLWIGSVHFLSKYNRQTDNFTRFNQPGWFNHPVLDNMGILWCTNSENILFWNNKEQRFDTLKFTLNEQLSGLKKNFNFSINFDNKGQLWINYQDLKGIHYLSRINLADSAHKAIYMGEWDIDSYRKTLPSGPTLNLQPVISPGGSIWLISNYGVFKLNPQNQKFLPDPFFDPEIQLTGADANLVAKVKEYLKYMLPTNSANIWDNALDSKVTENYLVDRQKNIWQSFITKGGGATGLTRSVPTPKGFRHYFMEYNPKNSLNSFFPVLKDKFGTVWGGATNQNKYFLRDMIGNDKQIIPIDKSTLNIALRPRAFLEDSTGIWVGYFGGVILRYEFASKKFTTALLKKTDLAERSLPHSVLHLKKYGDNLLIVGFNDIFLYNPKTKEFKALKQFLPDERINLYSVTRDQNNNWWIGANLSCLFFFGHDFKTMKTFHVGKGEFNIEDIVEGDNNDLWLSTLGGGLAHFDKATGKSRIYTTADGLSNNTCYGMQKDHHGNLWISTDHGISRFNPKTEQFRAFGPNDGLKIDEFNSDNTYQAPDSEIFFGGMGGVVSFYPDSITDDRINPHPAPLVIEDFKVSGENRYFNKAIYECDTVVLNKGDNNFQLTFACLDFRNADKIKYRYRLSGENNQFVVVNHLHRFVNYSNLAPGDYQLYIGATNRDGDWVAQIALTIIIPAFYYHALWFRLLVILLLAILAGYLIYSYNHRIRLKARQQQEELRLESLRGQMNPHFIFNSLNSINYFISQNDRLSANRYIADFSRLIRTILGNTTSDYIPMQKELESLQDYLQLEHLRFGDKFDYQIDLDETIEAETLNVAPGMVQPFIENAIWHGVRGLESRKGFVRVAFQPGKLVGSVRCIIEDDGIGRKLSEERKSNLPGKKSRGISIIIERLTIINNMRKTNFKMMVEDHFPDRKETGTRITIDIPLKQG